MTRLIALHDKNRYRYDRVVKLGAELVVINPFDFFVPVEEATGPIG